MTVLADLHPVLGLRIAAGPVELRGLTDDDLVRLADLAVAGIHDPGFMPFGVPWTDVSSEDLPANLARYHWDVRATFGPAAWRLELGVWHDGKLVGVQGFGTRDYLVTRTGETGSWLGRAHQGRGIGTRMRRAMCAFLFDELDAEEITSCAFVDNPASLGVSRKVGYQPNGRRRLLRRGAVAINQGLVLTRDTFDRGDVTIEVDGAAAVRRAIGLDPRP